MKIAVIESSGKTASVALAVDGTLRGEYTLRHGLTHSETLLPMMDTLLRSAGLRVAELDALAVSAGPGSFTGLRIGVAMAKGLAQAAGLGILPVPTLEGLAYQYHGDARRICPIMDARRGQVYSGIYRFDESLTDGTGADVRSPETVKDAGRSAETSIIQHGGRRYVLQCEAEGACLMLEEQLARLDALGGEVVFLGDGVDVRAAQIAAQLHVPYSFAPQHRRYQSAACVAAAACDRLMAGAALMDAADFTPEYLRKSQAERERMAGAAEDGGGLGSPVERMEEDGSGHGGPGGRA